MRHGIAVLTALAMTILAAHVAIGQPLVVGVQGQVTQLDPHRALSMANRLVRDQIYEGLFRLDDSLSVEGVLAEQWNWQDSDHLLIKLRPGVRFHNGTELVAQDVKFSIDRLRQQSSPYARKLVSITSVSTPDDRTVVISFAQAKDAGLTPLLFVYVVSEAWFTAEQGMTLEGTRPLVTAVGTGPFKFVNWKQGIGVVLEQNWEWWGHRRFRAPDAVHLLEFRETSPLVTELSTAKVNLAIGLSRLDQYKFPDHTVTRPTADWGEVVLGPRFIAPANSLSLHMFTERR